MSQLNNYTAAVIPSSHLEILPTTFTYSLPGPAPVKFDLSINTYASYLNDWPEALAGSSYVLPDGVVIGQRKFILLQQYAEVGTPAIRVVPDNFLDGEALEFASEGDYAELLWVPNGWRLMEGWNVNGVGFPNLIGPCLK